VKKLGTLKQTKQGADLVTTETDNFLNYLIKLNSKMDYLMYNDVCEDFVGLLLV
jgi:hypothetical protein